MQVLRVWRRWPLRLRVLSGAVVALLVVAGMASAVVAQSVPPPPSFLPSPPENRDPGLEAWKIPVTDDPVQADIRRQAILDEMRERGELEGDRVVPASGPETAGNIITVAGRRIQLPPDVYIKSYIVAGLCRPGAECLPTPVYALARGSAVVSVSAPTGQVYFWEDASPENFAFLMEALSDVAQ